MPELILRPSAAGVWVHCPGSVRMQDQYPALEAEDEQAEIGNAAHWVASNALQTVSLGMEPDAYMYIGQTAPNGILINDEIAECVQMYCDDVYKVAKDNNLCNALAIEKYIHCYDVHEDCYGTPDLAMYDATKHHLYIHDYKHGHLAVNEYWQLICYGLGHIGKRFANVGEPQVTLHLTIVQPRAFHREGPIREWVVTLPELRAHRNRLESAANEALSDDPPTCSGPWCRDCTARRVCETAQKAAYNAVDLAGKAMPVELTNHQLGVEYTILERASKALEYRLNAIESQLEGVISSGGSDTGYSLISGNSNRWKWAKPAKEVITLGELMGVDLSKEPDIITPKQAIKKGIDESIVRSMVDIPKTKAKLVPSDQTPASAVFSNKRG